MHARHRLEVRGQEGRLEGGGRHTRAAAWEGAVRTSGICNAPRSAKQHRMPEARPSADRWSFSSCLGARESMCVGECVIPLFATIFSSIDLVVG